MSRKKIYVPKVLGQNRYTVRKQGKKQGKIDFSRALRHSINQQKAWER